MSTSRSNKQGSDSSTHWSKASCEPIDKTIQGEFAEDLTSTPDNLLARPPIHSDAGPALHHVREGFHLHPDFSPPFLPKLVMRTVRSAPRPHPGHHRPPLRPSPKAQNDPNPTTIRPPPDARVEKPTEAADRVAHHRGRHPLHKRPRHRPLEAEDLKHQFEVVERHPQPEGVAEELVVGHPRRVGDLGRDLGPEEGEAEGGRPGGDEGVEGGVGEDVTPAEVLVAGDAFLREGGGDDGKGGRVGWG